MVINEEKTNQIISNKFEIDFIEITLTQQTENNPLVYSGSGSIFQTQDGTLRRRK